MRVCVPARSAHFFNTLIVFTGLYLPKDEETLTASATQTRLFKEKGAMVSNAIILVEGNISAGKSTLCNSVRSALIARVSTLQRCIARIEYI